MPILYPPYRACDRLQKKNSNFAGFCRDKIAEKSDDFVGILWEFLGQTWPESNWYKNGGFCGYFRANFARN